MVTNELHPIETKDRYFLLTWGPAFSLFTLDTATAPLLCPLNPIKKPPIPILQNKVIGRFYRKTSKTPSRSQSKQKTHEKPFGTLTPTTPKC
jgi:hypothetical protein